MTRYIIRTLVKRKDTSIILGMDQDICVYVLRNMQFCMCYFKRARYDDCMGLLYNSLNMVKIQLASAEIPGVVT